MPSSSPYLRATRPPGRVRFSSSTTRIGGGQAHRCAKEEMPVLGKATTIATARVYGDPLLNGMSSSRPADIPEAAGPARGVM